MPRWLQMYFTEKWLKELSGEHSTLKPMNLLIMTISAFLGSLCSKKCPVISSLALLLKISQVKKQLPVGAEGRSQEYNLEQVMIITLLFPHNYCAFLLTNNFMMRIAVPRIGCKIPCSLHQSLIIFRAVEVWWEYLQWADRNPTPCTNLSLTIQVWMEKNFVINYRKLFVLKIKCSICTETSIL